MWFADRSAGFAGFGRSVGCTLDGDALRRPARRARNEVADVGGTTDTGSVKSERRDDRDQAELDAGIAARLAAVDFGRELADEGITTVALDNEGNIVEHRPDGTTTRLETEE